MVWRTFCSPDVGCLKILYLARNQSLESSIRLFLAHLQDTGKSHRYIQEFCYVLARLSLFLNVQQDLSGVSTKQWWSSVSAMWPGESARKKKGVYLNWCHQQGWFKHDCLVVGAGTSKTRTRRVLELPPGHEKYSSAASIANSSNIIQSV